MEKSLSGSVVDVPVFALDATLLKFVEYLIVVLSLSYKKK